MQECLVWLPTIAFLSESSPSDVELHRRTLLAIATMSKDLLYHELLCVLLSYRDGISAFLIEIEWTEILNMCHDYLVLNQILYCVNRTGYM